MATAITYNELQALYLGLFDRPADAGGETYWESNSTSASSTAQSLGGFAQYYSDDKGGAGVAGAAISSSNITGEITNLYTNMLGYTPAAGDAGVAYWAGVFNSDITTMTAGAAIGSIANQIFNIVESLPANSPYINDQKFLNNAIATASSYTAANAHVTYNNAAYLTEGQAIITTPTMTTLNLTTGIDNLAPVGNTNIYGTFYGTSASSGSTLNALDTIAATGSNNTLVISATVANMPISTVNVSGVQTAKITSTVGLVSASTAAKANAAYFDVTSWNGLTNLNVTTAGTTTWSGTSFNIDNIKAGSGTSVTVKDASNYIATSGGDNITITNSGNNVYVGSNSSTNATTTTIPTGAVNVTNSSGSVVIDGGTTVQVAESGNGNITIDKYQASTGAITVNDTGGTGTITIDGGASAKVSSTATTLGPVDVSGVTGNTIVTESGVTGGTDGSYITGGTGATFITTGDAVNYNLTLGGTAPATGIVPIAGNASITDTMSGPNQDVLTAYATGTVNIATTADSGNITVGTTAKADDPTGIVAIVNDTVAGSSTYYGTSTTDVYTNGSTSVSITGAGATTIADEGTTNALASVVLTGVQGAAGITSTALTSLTIDNSVAKTPSGATATATTATVNNSTANHTLAVSLNGDTNVNTAVTDDHAAKIAVTATGAANNIITTDTLTGAKTFAFTNNGTGTLTVNGITDTNTTGDTVTAAGTGAINFSSVLSGLGATNLPTINASQNSGGITATILGTQGFTGGSGANTITVTSSAPIDTTINGGSGHDNTLVVTSAATNYATGFGGSLTGFQNLELGAGATGNYSSGNYTGLIIDNTGAAAGMGFTSVTDGTSLAIQDTANTTAAITISADTAASGGVVTIDGVSTAAFTGTTVIATDAATIAANINELGLAGVHASSSAGVITVTGEDSVSVTSTAGITDSVTTSLANLNSESLATTTGVNTLPLTIGTASSSSITGVLDEANNRNINITSSSSSSSNTNTLTIDDKTSSSSANSAAAIKISGAGNINLNYQVVGTATNALTSINASSSSGNINLSGIIGATSGMTITGGSGSLTVAGSGVVASTVTGAPVPVTSYFNAVDNITTGSGGGTITIGYGGANSGTGSETINLAASTAVSDTIVVPTAATYGVHAAITGFTVSPSASVSDVLTMNATNTVLATKAVAGTTAGADQYTVSNGVITFTGSDSAAQMLTDAKALINAAGDNYIAAYFDGTNTVAVGSGASATSATDVVLTLKGDSGITQLGGITAAAGNIVSTNITGATHTADALTTTHTVNDLGYSVQALSGVTGASSTVTYNNLAPSAIINDSSTGSGYNLTTTQTGTAGSDSLTLNLSGASSTITTATFNGDNAITINPTATSVISTLVDGGSTNTLSGITIGGTATFHLDAITDTALTSLTINDTGTATAGDTTALSQNGLTVNIGSVAGAGTVVDLSGNNDVVKEANANTGTITDSGNGLTFTDSGSSHVNTIDATGTGNNITIAATNTSANSITVGANSTITLGTTDSGGSNITITGDTAGTSLTNITTIQNVDDGHTTATFFASGTEVTGTLVNVASATSLSGALNLAAENLTNHASGSNYYDYFQYAGDTYVVGHQGTGTAETGLSAKDIVVELIGLHTPALTVSTHAVLL